MKPMHNLTVTQKTARTLHFGNVNLKLGLGKAGLFATKFMIRRRRI